MNVVLRKCPDCGGELVGRPGLSWMACRDCPLALDPFVEPARRLQTFRPADEVPSSAPRLAFYVFEIGKKSGPSWIWIPAYRSLGSESLDAGELLTDKSYAPPLAEAPLDAGLARTPEQALQHLKIRRGPKSAGASSAATPRLVSLRCNLDGERVVEPVSGFSIAQGALRPPLVKAGPRPG